MEPDHHYRLLERKGEEGDVREARRILAEVKSGKQKTHTRKEFERLTGSRTQIH